MNEQVAVSRGLKLTAAELEGARKGYTRAFTDYTDTDAVVLLPQSERDKIEGWCRNFLDAGIEIGGAFVFGPGLNLSRDNEAPLGVVPHPAYCVEKAYCYGGNTKFLRTTVEPDAAHMLAQVQKDYPEMYGFFSNRVGWFHLHPGYFGDAILSVGDVMEIREGNKDWPELWSLNLLVYGNPANGQFSIGAFIVCHDAVYRLRVVSE